MARAQRGSKVILSLVVERATDATIADVLGVDLDQVRRIRESRPTPLVESGVGFELVRRQLLADDIARELIALRQALAPWIAGNNGGPGATLAGHNGHGAATPAIAGKTTSRILLRQEEEAGPKRTSGTTVTATYVRRGERWQVLIRPKGAGRLSRVVRTEAEAIGLVEHFNRLGIREGLQALRRHTRKRARRR